MRSTMRWVLWFVVFVAAVVSVWVGAGRWRVEQANRRVEIVLDWDEVRGLAETTGQPLPGVLRAFYQAGARGIAIGEETVGEMQSTRRVEVLSLDDAPRGVEEPVLAEMQTLLDVPDDDLRDRIAEVLRMKWNLDVQETRDVLVVPVAWSELATLTIGFPEDVVEAVRKAHLEPVMRLANYSGADAETIDWSLARIRALGGRLVIFGGDQVLGFPDTVDEAADQIRAQKLVFGQVEFGKQKGEAGLGTKLKGEMVRVHSISPAEMGRLTEPDAVERFTRAAEERNIRALYVRLLPGAQVPPLDENVRYVNAIARRVRGAGLEPGLAAPFAGYDSALWQRALIGAGVAAATVLLVSYVFPFSTLLWALLLVMAALDIVLPAISIGRKLVALQGALLLPVLSFAWVREVLGPPRDAHRSSWSSLVRAALRAIPLLLAMTVISAIGGLFVVGLLSGRLASMKLLEFSGVKLQQAGAILLVAGIYYLDIHPRGGWPALRERWRHRIAEIWGQPLLLGGLFVAFVAVAALGMLLARSGNEPGVGVSGMELRFRSLLDQLLLVRPRTKEFMLGHPALLLGLALLVLRKARWGLPLLVVGAIGQVSIVNTFSHLHTPLAVSTLRVVNGLWTGILVALVVAWITDRIARRVR